MTIAILGESGAGKTTLVNNFVKSQKQYNKIVEYTTRPKRDSEVEGSDHKFITIEQFKDLIAKNFFADYIQYREWFYGISKQDLDCGNSIAVFNPTTLRRLKSLKYDIVSVYLNVDRRSRLINILNRGDEIEEAYRRNITEVGQFDGIEKETDYVIQNYQYCLSQDETLQKLQQIVVTEAQKRFERYKQVTTKLQEFFEGEKF